ncbi:MAG TPA: TIGR02996 domain-containing protein [Pirellulaceae bacterium]|jgi:uncharacterized protein (TIGR02996 family)|nr:TIGR02996 domain-containing protein [Pirellulaceae bacterium]
MFEDPTAEERPFVEAVCAAPADLEPRLIFADWLDDQGDSRAEFLRDSILIEQAIRRLGWGFAFASWRAVLPYASERPELGEAMNRIRRAALPTHGQLPGPLRRATGRHRYAGGFIENVGISSRKLLEESEAVRRTIPLRGVLAGEMPLSMGGLDLLEHEEATWRGIDRLVLPHHVADPESDFAPFRELERAERFAELAPGLTALAVDGPESNQWAPLFRFLSRTSLQSLIVASNFVPLYGSAGMLENWLPTDLRCLGFPFADVSDSALVRLAEWPGLTNLRLLDLSNSTPGVRAWMALERSRYRRDDLVVLHAGARWTRHGDDRPIDQILVEKTHGAEGQRPANFFDAATF